MCFGGGSIRNAASARSSAIQRRGAGEVSTVTKEAVFVPETGVKQEPATPRTNAFGGQSSMPRIGGSFGSATPAGTQTGLISFGDASPNAVRQRLNTPEEYKAFYGRDYVPTNFKTTVGVTAAPQSRVAIVDEGKLRRATRSARSSTANIQGTSSIRAKRRGGLRIDSSSSQISSSGSGVNVPT